MPLEGASFGKIGVVYKGNLHQICIWRRSKRYRFSEAARQLTKVLLKVHTQASYRENRLFQQFGPIGMKTASDRAETGQNRLVTIQLGQNVYS